jgi:dimethylamine/trimethylamine dehydrogenase
MARSPRHDILFEPVPIGPHTLKNRFYQVPHCTGFGTSKPWSQAAHRTVKAEGGWAAVCTEFASISPESDEMPYTSVTLWDSGDVMGLSLMCDEAHRYGALAGIELHHSGAHCERRESRWPSVAPSQIASDYGFFRVPEAPKEMEVADIKRLVSDWAQAAIRARDAGFDIVYVYGGHSYLLPQFLSPYFNRRTDEYGGSFQNRARIWLETLQAVKGAVGNDCAIAVRLAIDALDASRIPVEETLDFIRLADDLVDLWDVNVGSSPEWQRDSGASRFYEEGYQLEYTKHARKATVKPIVGVGRLTNPDQMVQILRSGVVDLIGAARPSIADPFLPKKIEDGRLDEIRECMGINSCAARAVHGRHLGCAQNATAGEEYRRSWHPEQFDKAQMTDKDVLVVGAGPAGMECAIVLGKRGIRRVHLAEAADEIGGTMRWIPRLPSLGQWARFVNYRRIQLDKLRNVQVITNARLDAAAIRDYGAEIVVLATGSYWSRDGLNAYSRNAIEGADARLDYVLTPEQIMLEGKRPTGPRVIVYDCEGYFMGGGIAETLNGDGYDVHLITPHPVVAQFCEETLEGPMFRQRMHDAGIRMRVATSLRRVDRGQVPGQTEYGDSLNFDANSVVLVTQRLSDDFLYRELMADPARLEAAGIDAVYRVGDCVAPRTLADVVFDGHRLGREIDGPHPGTPLPYLRERALRTDHDRIRVGC